MENSEKLLFGDDVAQWYLALGTKWVGPMTAAEVYEKILAHEITWAHYIWRKGQADWKRICDIKPFQATVPQQPAKGVQKEVKEVSRPIQKQQAQPARKAPAAPQAAAPQAAAPYEDKGEVRNWYLHYSNSQYGPFSVEEILHFIKIGKIHGQVHGWREGMKNWDRLERLDAFRQALGGAPAETRKPPRVEKQPAARTDQRSAPRRPLIAKILMTDEQSVIVGVCRDISVGGLQVLTDRIPANVGAKLKMNISPSSNDSGNPIESFVAEGVIVRILEDGRGFSFRFERLPERSKLAIEAYFASPS